MQRPSAVIERDTTMINRTSVFTLATALLITGCQASAATGPADLHISFAVPGGNHWVYAGQIFDTTVRVTNQGAYPSTGTVVGFSWVDDAAPAMDGPGFTTATDNANCCDGFSLRPGESVEIVFNGATFTDKHTSYSIAVTAGNDQSPGESLARLSIVAYTETVCIAGGCFDGPEGTAGGSASVWFLAALVGIALRRRNR